MIRGLQSAVFLVSLTCPTVALADECSDILKNGVQDTLNLTQSRSLEHATREAVCAKGSRKSSSAGEMGFTFPLDGIPINFGAADSHTSSRRQEFCTDFSRQLNNAEATNIAKRVASPVIVAAWERCMDGHKLGLSCDVAKAANQHRVKVSWNMNGYEAPPPVIRRVTFLGTSCTGPAAGTSITSPAPAIFLCKNTGDDPGYVSIETSNGFAECSVPNEPVPLKPAQYLSECVKENKEACSLYMEQSYEKLGECKRSLRDPTPPASADPKEQERYQNELQQHAVLMRKCASIVDNYRALYHLTANVSTECEGDSASPKCLEAKKALQLNQ